MKLELSILLKKRFHVKSGKPVSGLVYTAQRQVLAELRGVFTAELVAADSTEGFRTSSSLGPFWDFSATVCPHPRKHTHRRLHLIPWCSQLPREFMYSTLSSALGIFSVGDTNVRGRIQEKCNDETGGIEFQMESRDRKN